MSDETIRIEGTLTLVKSEHLPDWYLIERATHDNKMWMEKVEHGEALRYSGRISDADIEGSAEEMLDIAQAIMSKSEFRAKRCAVQVKGEIAYFWSPRNSQRKAEVPSIIADLLASVILGELKQLPGTPG